MTPMDKQRSSSVLLPAVSKDPEGFGSDFFWEAHWKKVVAVLVGIVLAILGAGAWAFHRAKTASESAASSFALLKVREVTISRGRPWAAR